MEEKEWIILNYNLPKEPSRVRVSTWRRLKKLGAVSIGQSMWLLPSSEEKVGIFTEISNDICQNGGEAYILKADFIGNKNSTDIIAEFNRARDEEYSEVLEKCVDFFDEMEKEHKRENYTFAEIEENEYEYNKLMNWYKDIEQRDFFGAPRKDETLQRLGECRQELEDFSKKTFDVNIK
jgi:hypothetical protein